MFPTLPFERRINPAAQLRMAYRRSRRPRVFEGRFVGGQCGGAAITSSAAMTLLTATIRGVRGLAVFHNLGSVVDWLSQTPASQLWAQQRGIYCCWRGFCWPALCW